MKKFISVLAVIVMLFSVLTLPALAHKNNASYGDVPKSKDAITIDAVKDAVYDKGLMIPIMLGTGEECPVGGNGWLLWQDGFLFVYAEVKETYVMPKENYVDESGQPWMTDSVEVFLDWDNNMEDNEFDQYRIDAYGWRSFELRITTGESSYGQDENVADGIFEGKAKIGGEGYQVEFKIPLHGGKGAGADIGFLFQINDQDADDAHTIAHSTPSTVDAYASLSWKPLDADYIVLSAAEVTAAAEPEPEPEPEASAPAAETPPAETPAPAPAPTAPKTGDSGTILILLAAAALTAVNLRKSKSKI